MTKKKAIEWLQFLKDREHTLTDSVKPCNTEVALDTAIKALEQPTIVRCADCIHGINTSNLDVLCTRADYPNKYRDYDDFCKYGRKKE